MSAAPPRTALSASLPSARFDKAGRVLAVNDAWLEACGFTRDEVIGSTMRIIQGRDTEPQRVAALLAACRARQAHTTTITNYTKRGVKFANHIQLLPDAADEFVTVNTIDFILPESVPAVVLHAEKGVVAENSQWQGSARAAVEDLLGDGLRELCAEEEVARDVAELRRSFKAREAAKRKVCGRTADGLDVEVEVELQPAGTRRCVARFEVKSRLPSHKAGALFDKEGCVVEVNDAWLYVCGFSRSEVVGQKMRLIQGPRTEEEKVAQLLSACQARKSLRVTITNYDKNRQAFANTIKLFPVENGGFITHNEIQFLPDEDVPSALFDEHGKVLQVNKLWLNFCGFSAQEVVGRTMKIIQGPETEMDKVGSLLDACRERRKAVVTVTNYTKQQHMFANKITLIPVGGKHFLTRNEITFKLVRHEPSALFDSRGRILDVNELWLSHCGYTREEVVGRTAKMLQGPETEEISLRSLLSFSARREKVCVSVTNYTKSGCKMINVVSLWPVGVDHFITLNRFKYCLRKDIPSARFDKTGKVVRVNNAWLRHCGFRRDEVLGKTMKIIQGPETEPEKVKVLLKACKDRAELSITITNYTKTGLRFRNAIKLFPIGTSEFITENIISFVLDEARPAALVSSEGELLQVNEQFGAAFGRRNEKLVGASLSKACMAESEEDRLAINKLLEQASKTACLTCTVYGARVKARVSCAAATPTDFICTFDVSSVLDSKEPSVLFDKRGKVLEVNQAWLDVCGFHKEEVLGHTMRIIQGRDTEARKVRQLLDACAKRTPLDITLTNYTKDRTKFSNHLQLKPLGTENFITVSRIQIQLPRDEPALRFDADLKILDVTEPWLGFLGVTREAVIGSNVLSYLAGDQETHAMQQVPRNRAGSEVSLVWMSSSGVRVKGNATVKASMSGEFVMLCALKYLLPQSTPAALFDCKGVVMDVNSIWLQYCGFKREEVVGKTMRIIQGKDTEQAQVERLLEACRRREQCKVTITNYTKDGVKVRNEISLEPVGADSFITVNRFKFVGVLDSKSASCLCDKQGRIVDANPLWLDFCEYSLEEVVGKSLTVLSGKETEVHKTEELLEAISTGTRVSTYVTNYTKSGTKFLNSVMAKPVGEKEVILDCHMRVLLCTDVASALFNQDGKVKDVNGAWMKFCGFKREEIVGKTMALIQGPNTEKDKVEALLAACRKREKLSITITNYTKSGHIVANTINLKPVGSKQFVTTNTFRFILSKTIPSLLLNAKSQVEDVNAPWLDAFERIREAVVGKGVQEVLATSSSEVFKFDELKQALRKRVPKQVSFLHSSKKRSFRDEVTLSPVGIDQFIIVHRVSNAIQENLQLKVLDPRKAPKRRRQHGSSERKAKRSKDKVRKTPSSLEQQPMNGQVAVAKGVSAKCEVLQLKFVHAESWHASYVRTRHKNLRCFPFCSPSHRERSFCGLPITVMYPSDSIESAKKLNMIGCFRKAKAPLLLNCGGRSAEVFEKEHQNEIIAGLFTAYDKEARLGTYEFRPPRKWRYKCEQNKYTTSELHTFTVYLLQLSEATNAYECVGSKDSPAFNIVSAWNQSLETVSRPLTAAKEVRSASSRPDGQSAESANSSESMPPYADAAMLAENMRKGKRSDGVERRETEHDPNGNRVYSEMYRQNYYPSMSPYSAAGHMMPPYYDMYPRGYPPSYGAYMPYPPMYPSPFPPPNAHASSGSSSRHKEWAGGRRRRGDDDSRTEVYSSSSMFHHVHDPSAIPGYMHYQFANHARASMMQYYRNRASEGAKKWTSSSSASSSE